MGSYSPISLKLAGSMNFRISLPSLSTESASGSRSAIASLNGKKAAVSQSIIATILPPLKQILFPSLRSL